MTANANDTLESSRPDSGSRHRIIVIGAGMAGLVAGDELHRRGHDVVILEAQNRVGGRVHTLRTFGPGLYAEAGAMRIPRAHDLTLRYCTELGLPVRPFVTANPKGLVHVAGTRRTHADVQADPTALAFELAPHERGRSVDVMWAETIAEMRVMVERDGAAAWDAIARDYDQYSLFGFLEQCGWSSGAIECFGVMNFSSPICTTCSSKCCARNSAGPTSTWSRSPAEWTSSRTRSARECSGSCVSARRSLPSTRTRNRSPSIAEPERDALR